MRNNKNQNIYRECAGGNLWEGRLANKKERPNGNWTRGYGRLFPTRGAPLDGVGKISSEKNINGNFRGVCIAGGKESFASRGARSLSRLVVASVQAGLGTPPQAKEARGAIIGKEKCAGLLKYVILYIKNGRRPRYGGIAKKIFA